MHLSAIVFSLPSESSEEGLEGGTPESQRKGATFEYAGPAVGLVQDRHQWHREAFLAASAGVEQRWDLGLTHWLGHVNHEAFVEHFDFRFF